MYFSIAKSLQTIQSQMLGSFPYEMLDPRGSGTQLGKFSGFFHQYRLPENPPASMHDP